MIAAKLWIEINAGVIPEQPMPEFRRRFELTNQQVYPRPDATPDEKERLLSEWRRVHGEALMYFLELQNPNRVNWARMDWIWL
ncbi:MAG TPA: hypothetical protein VGQ52_13755 [Gemmatimonadaceae bacterium]|jgi:hypothetical protein|nr:hypothetical protein [Gemmatimonadaceae bacterium]